MEGNHHNYKSGGSVITERLYKDVKQDFKKIKKVGQQVSLTVCVDASDVFLWIGLIEQD